MGSVFPMHGRPDRYRPTSSFLCKSIYNRPTGPQGPEQTEQRIPKLNRSKPPHRVPVAGGQAASLSLQRTLIPIAILIAIRTPKSPPGRLQSQQPCRRSIHHCSSLTCSPLLYSASGLGRAYGGPGCPKKKICGGLTHWSSPLADI